MIGNRIVQIVAFNQYGIKSSNRAALVDGAATLEQPRQQGENRRRITARSGRFTDCQAKLPLGQPTSVDFKGTKLVLVRTEGELIINSQ